MRMRHWLGAVLLFLLFLLWQAPATLLPPLLKKYTAGQAELSVSGGTIWNGQAYRLAWRQTQLWQDVQWQLSPWHLLLGKAHLTLRSAGRSAVAEIGSDRIGVQAERMQLPLSLLGDVNKALAAYQLRGIAELQSSGFAFALPAGEGRLTVRLLDIGSGLVAVPTLGDYRLSVVALKRGYRFDVSTERGVLRVSGEGRWEPGQGGSVRLQLHPEAQLDALRPLLSLAGRPGENGDYYLSTSFR